ncbi:hypothetical protein F8M41_014455 [Gigaspora margarita]|uniref:Uncharacterized protein n=1 Tax=Gigaspora margarita TaxID=4874 RepID=A0A8H4ARG1_GIGMA|nr:hypothetical protein F8M41_014455 [Gigaspora margarita]
MDSSNSENSTTSSENELETNILACLWNESGSSFSETSESSNSESNSKEYEVNATKKKITYSNTKRSKKHKSAKPKTSSKKSSASSDKKSSKDTRLLKIPTNNITLNAFFTILRSIVDSFTYNQSKEVSINRYNMINAKFIALKDPVLNHFTSNFSDKE